MPQHKQESEFYVASIEQKLQQKILKLKEDRRSQWMNATGY